MATAIQRAIEVARTISGNSPWTLAFPEAASQTFKKGAFVTLDASGCVVECGADPARILGIAAADGANDSVAGNSSTTVWIAGDDTIFVGNVGLTGALTQVTANTDVGGRYGISKNAASPTNWRGWWRGRGSRPSSRNRSRPSNAWKELISNELL
jgi:hypothetical protein